MIVLQKAKPRVQAILLLVLLGCVLMYAVEVWLQPSYFTKSLIKLLVFGGLPLLLLGRAHRAKVLTALLKPRESRQLVKWGLAGVGVYLLLLGGYALLRPFIDLEQIAARLGGSLGVTRQNFIYVALYISVVNSFLEEFFFRGLGFLTLKGRVSAPVAHGFSAIAFALYHVAILTSWFSPLLFLAMIAGLCITGVFFNLLDAVGESIYPSWVVHLCANLAINTIGLQMFEII